MSCSKWYFNYVSLHPPQVLNLFLALLLNAFASDTLDQKKDEAGDESKLVLAFDKLKRWFCCCCPRFRGKVEPEDEKDGEGGDTKVDVETGE